MRAVRWLLALAVGVSACSTSQASQQATVPEADQSVAATSQVSPPIEHLPVPVQTLAPSVEVLKALDLDLCGTGSGPFTFSRRYCGKSDVDGFSMTVGMSAEEHLALDPAFELTKGPRPEGVEVVVLRDGSHAEFFDDFWVGCEVEGIGSVPCTARTHRLSLNWVSPSGYPIALRTTFNETDLQRSPLGVDELVMLANSIETG